MRPSLALSTVFSALAACGPGADGDAPATPADCPLAMEWQAQGPAGGMGSLIVAPSGRMAWSVLGAGEGTAELEGRDLHIRFDAPAHEFQVSATLSDDCRSGEGTIDIRRYPGDGQTGTFPITLQAGRAEAWRDHYALREGES